MAHFAEIDSNNVVLRVLVVDNSQEHRGQEFLAQDCQLGGRWIQTSYNSNIRNMFAEIGGTYDEEKDIFIPRKPYPSWILNSENRWEAPVTKPEPESNEDNIQWDEETLSWINIGKKAEV